MGVSATAEPCVTQKDKSWICKGDKAWENGYLVLTSRLKELLQKEELFDEVKGQRDEYSVLLDRMQQQRNAYQDLNKELQSLLDLSIVLREDYKKQREDMEKELEVVREDYKQHLVDYAELQAEAGEGWSPLEVGLLTGGVAILSGLAGVGIYAIVQAVR
jgi:hypothetical protein